MFDLLPFFIFPPVLSVFGPSLICSSTYTLCKTPPPPSSFLPQSSICPSTFEVEGLSQRCARGSDHHSFLLLLRFSFHLIQHSCLSCLEPEAPASFWGKISFFLLFSSCWLQKRKTRLNIELGAVLGRTGWLDTVLLVNRLLSAVDGDIRPFLSSSESSSESFPPAVGLFPITAL